MALKAIPARATWVWAWPTPAWAATVRPTISAVAAMLSTAVIQRRTRRVIVTSLIRLRPVVGDHRWFEAAAAPDGYRIAAGTGPPARREARELLARCRGSAEAGPGGDQLAPGTARAAGHGRWAGGEDAAGPCLMPARWLRPLAGPLVHAPASGRGGARHRIAIWPPGTRTGRAPLIAAAPARCA